MWSKGGISLLLRGVLGEEQGAGVDRVESARGIPGMGE